MIWPILSSLIPVFGLILLGFVCGKRDVLGERGFEVLNRFVITLALPVLTFRTIAKMEAGGSAVSTMIVAVLGGALGIYALAFWIARLLRRTAVDANVAALATSYSNTAFVGLPIVYILYGPESLAPTAVAAALNAAVIFSIAVLIADLVAPQAAGGWAGAKAAASAVSRNPLILSAVLGAVWAGLQLPLEGPADVLLETLGAATAPCALTAIGLFMAKPSAPAEPPVIARIVGFKLIAQPLLTLGVVLLLPPMPPLWAKIAVVMAGMPTGTSSFILAGRAGKWAMETSARAIVVSTLGSAVTLGPLLWLIDTQL